MVPNNISTYPPPEPVQVIFMPENKVADIS